MTEHIIKLGNKIQELESYKRNNELLNINYRSKIAIAHNEIKEIKEQNNRTIQSKHKVE